MYIICTATSYMFLIDCSGLLLNNRRIHLLFTMFAWLSANEWTDGKIVFFSIVIIVIRRVERKKKTSRLGRIQSKRTEPDNQRRSHSLDISAFVTVVMCLRFCKLRMRDVDQFMDNAHVMYVTSTEVDVYTYIFLFIFFFS